MLEVGVRLIFGGFFVYYSVINYSAAFRKGSTQEIKCVENSIFLSKTHFVGRHPFA